MGELAVLSYHGWEIDPARLIDDVTSLRRSGWQDCSLADVEAIVSGARACDRNYFHVTLDDGAEQDLACVEALGRVSCAATLFISLDAMTDAARLAYRALLKGGARRHRHRRSQPAAQSHVSLATHHRLSLRRSAAHDLAGSPGSQNGRSRLRLRRRARAAVLRARPARPRVVPAGRPGHSGGARDAGWTDALAASLIDAGLAFRRLRRLCVAGEYETREQFRARITPYLLEGRDRLFTFTGRAPVAFAHPWWQPSPTADQCLLSLGYRLTFSGHGLWRKGPVSAIPRVFVSNETARPLAPERAAAPARSILWAARIRDLGRRALWA